MKAFVTVLVFFFASCIYGFSQTGAVYVNKAYRDTVKIRPYTKVFIFAQAKDIQGRVRVENAMEHSAKLRGYNVVKSIDIIPPSLQDTALPSRDTVLAAIRASGCDAVFAMRLISKSDKIEYEKAHTAYSKVPIYTWNGGLFGYYSDMALTTNSKAVYTNTKEYFILSAFFDVATEQMVFSVESDIVDPTDVDRFTNAYMGDVLKKMEKEKLIRKKPAQ